VTTRNSANTVYTEFLSLLDRKIVTEDIPMDGSQSPSSRHDSANICSVHHLLIDLRMAQEPLTNNMSIS